MLPYLIAGAIGFVVAKILEEDEAPKYDGGGSVLLASNGKPSNLTPEQYKLVRTPEFKKWFGEWENDPENASKVVDEETKEPLVMYHGGKLFNVFNKGIGVDKGIYFTDNKYFAQDIFALEVEVYERDKRGFEYDDVPEEMLESNQWDEKYFKYSKIYEVFLNVRKPKIYDSLDAKVIPKTYSNNIDGVIVHSTGDFGYKGNQIVVFEPTQIKLADGTNTTFDANNPDIRYAGGGRVNQQESIIEELKNNELLGKYLRGEYIGKNNNELYNSLKKYIPLKNKYPKIFKPSSNVFYRTDTILRTPKLEYEIMDMGIGQRDLPLIRHLSHFSADLLENVKYEPKNKLQGWTSDKDFVFEHWYNVYVMGQGGNYVFDEEKYFSCVYVLKDTTDLLFNEIFLDELRSYFNGNGDESESLRLGSEVNCDVIIIINADIDFTEQEY